MNGISSSGFSAPLLYLHEKRAVRPRFASDVANSKTTTASSSPVPVQPPEDFFGKANAWVKDTSDKIKSALELGSVVIHGGLGAAGVLIHSRQWDAAFVAANPDVKIHERIRSISDLAYAQYREGYEQALSEAEGGKAQPASEPDRRVRYELYRGVAKRFPKLLKIHGELPQGLDIIRKALDVRPGLSAEDLADALATLHADHGQLNDEQLSARLNELLP